ncbi:MAG: polyisoprenoid-binding protein YceI [Arenicella sp.]|jgi:polyisoprenoid-binding protein YceI
MIKKILIIGVVLAVVAVGIVMLVPWGEYESNLEKTELENVVEYDETQEITAPSIPEGTYSVTSENKTTAEILFLTSGLKDTKGGFDNFTIEFSVAAEFKSSSLSVEIETKSIQTGNVMRDEHLLEADFFDAEQYPTITYTANAIDFGDTSYVAKGSLTLNGTTKELDVAFLHLGGGEKDDVPFQAFEGSVIFDRTQYGQEESSGAGNEVTLNFYCELEKQ